MRPRYWSAAHSNKKPKLFWMVVFFFQRWAGTNNFVENSKCQNFAPVPVSKFALGWGWLRRFHPHTLIFSKRVGAQNSKLTSLFSTKHCAHFRGEIHFGESYVPVSPPRRFVVYYWVVYLERGCSRKRELCSTFQRKTSTKLWSKFGLTGQRTSYSPRLQPVHCAPNVVKFDTVGNGKW